MGSSTVSIGQAQLGIPKPIQYGLNHISGNLLLLDEITDATYGQKTRIAFFGYGRGELDGISRLFVNKAYFDHNNTALVHFHPGGDPPLGASLTPVSTGGDQLVDLFYNQLPAGLPVLFYPQLAYLAIKVPPDPNAPSADLDVIADVRGIKCREFDSSGTQTGYEWGELPTWWILDVIISYVVKRESLMNEGLTSAEKGRIDFASFADHAAYCYYQLSEDFAARFAGGVAFPARTTLTTALEQMLLMCRSYLLERSGVISIYADKPRTPSIVVTDRAVVPGTLSQNKRSLRGAANKFTGKFRDLLSPTLANIVTIARVSNVVTVVTDAAVPRNVGDYISVRRTSNPTFNDIHEYGDKHLITYLSGTTLKYSQAGADATGTGGVVNSGEEFFIERSPTLEHEYHQFAIGQRGVGLAPLPRRTLLSLDYGNNTYPRVMRLLEYQRIRYLGKRQAPYVGPWEGSLKLDWDYVDDNGVALSSVDPGKLMTLDSSVSDEINGDFELLEIEVPQIASGQRTEGGPLSVTAKLLQYVPEAFTDTAPAEQTLGIGYTGSGIILSSGPANFSYKPRSNPLTAHDAGSSVTVNIASFAMAVVGLDYDPTYSSAAIAGAPYGTILFIIVEDADLRGGNASFSYATDKASALGRVGWLFVGSIITPKAGGGDTVGNNDGGASVQTGARSRVYGSVQAGLGWADTSLINDGDGNSFGYFWSPDVAGNLDVLGFPAPPLSGFVALLLRVKSQFIAAVGGNNVIDYSLDDGSTWTNLRSSAASDANPVTSEVNLSLYQVVPRVRVRVIPPAPLPPPSSYAGSCAADVTTGTEAWTSYSSGQGATDGSYVYFRKTYVVGAGQPDPYALQFTNFGFSSGQVPNSATITGVQFDVTRFSVGQVQDASVMALDAGSTAGSELGSGGLWPHGVNTATYGGPGNMLGVAWTPSKVRASDFGLWLLPSVTLASNIRVSGAYIDCVRATVYLAGGGSATAIRMYDVHVEAQF